MTDKPKTLEIVKVHTEWFDRMKQFLGSCGEDGDAVRKNLVAIQKITMRVLKKTDQISGYEDLLTLHKTAARAIKKLEEMAWYIDREIFWTSPSAFVDQAREVVDFNTLQKIEPQPDGQP